MTQNAFHTGQRRWQQKERTIKWFCKQKPCKVCLFESFSSLTPKYMVDICRDKAYKFGAVPTVKGPDPGD